MSLAGGINLRVIVMDQQKEYQSTKEAREALSKLFL